MKSNRNVWLGGSVWLTAVLIGIAAIWAYEKRPGSDPQSPSQWVDNDLIDLNESGSTVVLFIHPRCPCSKASLAEFANIDFPDNASRHVVFYIPEAADPSWKQTQNVSTAMQLADTSVWFDSAGKVIELLGAKTSGHCTVYRPDGSLAYSGGLTISRGHRGENHGLSCAQAAAKGGKGMCEYPAYGCPLINP